MDDNNFTKPAFAVINAITLAVITGYLATEYLLPYVKRKFFLSSSLKTKLQVIYTLHYAIYNHPHTM